MANVGTLEATLKANVSDFKAGMDKAVASIQSVDQKMDVLSVTAGIQLVREFANAGRAVGRFAASMYQIGVESEAAGLRYRAVFGENTAALDRWVEDNRVSFGMAQDDMQGLVAQIANILTPLGLTTEAAGEQTTKILELAAAWSVWSGGQVSSADAAEILAKAVQGQTRGLITLGMNAAVVRDIESELTATMENGAAPADLLADSMARLDRITAQSGPALEVYGQAMGGAAGAQRAVQTAIAELQDALGKMVAGLAPAASGLAAVIGFAGKMPGLIAAVGSAVATIGALAAAAKLVGREFKLAQVAVGGFIGAAVGLAIYGAGQGTLMRDWADALEDLAPALMEGGAAIEAMRDRMIELGFSAHDIDPLIRRFQEELPEALDTVRSAIDSAVRDMFPDWIAALEDTADTTADSEAAQAALTEEIAGQHRALERLISSEERIADLRRAAIDPLFAVVDATGRLSQAQSDLSAAMATGDMTAAAEATERLYGAQLDLNAASGALNTDTAVAQLRNVLEQAGLAASEIDRIVANILTLNATTIDDKAFTITAIMHEPAGTGPLLGGRQHGGPVYPGGAVIVGEAGPELLTVSGRGAMVTPLGKIPKLAGGGIVPRKMEIGASGGTSYPGWMPPFPVPLDFPPTGDMGQNNGGGLTPMQAATFERMGWALPELTRKVEAMANMPKASGVGNIINVYVTVEGSIRSDRELAKVVEAELVRAVRRGGASEILS
jgi:hypothetical protein